MVNKNNNKKEIPNKNFALILGGIIVTIILISVISTQISQSEGNSNYVPSANAIKKVVKQSCQEVRTSYEEQEEYLKTEYYTETVPYTIEECDDVDLIYSMTDSKWDYATCNRPVA